MLFSNCRLTFTLSNSRRRMGGIEHFPPCKRFTIHLITIKIPFTSQHLYEKGVECSNDIQEHRVKRALLSVGRLPLPPHNARWINFVRAKKPLLNISVTDQSVKPGGVEGFQVRAERLLHLQKYILKGTLTCNYGCTLKTTSVPLTCRRNSALDSLLSLPWK